MLVVTSGLFMAVSTTYPRLTPASCAQIRRHRSRNRSTKHTAKGTTPIHSPDETNDHHNDLVRRTWHTQRQARTVLAQMVRNKLSLRMATDASVCMGRLWQVPMPRPAPTTQTTPQLNTSVTCNLLLFTRTMIMSDDVTFI